MQRSSKTMIDRLAATSPELIRTECCRATLPATFLATVRTNCGLYSGIVRHDRPTDSAAHGCWSGSIDARSRPAVDRPKIDRRLNLRLCCRLLPTFPDALFRLQVGLGVLAQPLIPRLWTYPNPAVGLALCLTFLTCNVTDFPCPEILTITITELLRGDVSTACDCQPNAFPFACPRHRCDKSEPWHTLCRTRAGLFSVVGKGNRAGADVRQCGPSTEFDPRAGAQSLEPRQHPCGLHGRRLPNGHCATIRPAVANL